MLLGDRHQTVRQRRIIQSAGVTITATLESHDVVPSHDRQTENAYACIRIYVLIIIINAYACICIYDHDSDCAAVNTTLRGQTRHSMAGAGNGLHR